MEMPMERLKPVAEEHHRNGAVCVLATGIGDYVRYTPLEYSFHEGQFWTFAYKPASQIRSPYP